MSTERNLLRLLTWVVLNDGNDPGQQHIIDAVKADLHKALAIMADEDLQRENADAEIARPFGNPFPSYEEAKTALINEHLAAKRRTQMADLDEKIAAVAEAVKLLHADLSASPRRAP